jgi:hypothetical protein
MYIRVIMDEQVVIDAQGRLMQHNGNYVIFNPKTSEYRATNKIDEVLQLQRIQLTSELDIQNLPGYTRLTQSPGGIAMPRNSMVSEPSRQQNTRKNSHEIDEAIEGISEDINKIAEAIGKYTIHKEQKQETINNHSAQLEELYNRLQNLPEDGFSEEFRIRVTDMKVKILQQMQIVEKMMPKMSAIATPDPAKALQGDYTDDELRLFVAASDVLRSYQQIQNVYFDQLTSEQQTEIVDFIRIVVNPLLEAKMDKRFVKEVLTLNALCQDLIAQIVGKTGHEMNLPEDDLEKQLLAETLIRVTTEVRPIGDSIQLTLESATLKDMGKVATTAVAGAAAATTLPMATSLVAQVSQGVASVISTAAPLVGEYPLQAYATIYHLISYITGKYEEQQLREPDFVFKRLFHDLDKQTGNERMEKIFGRPQPVLGWYDYGAILKNTLITFGKTACGQVERAGELFETTKKLPQATAQLCSRVGIAVQTYLHDTANRMAARPGVGMNPALFSKCADVMKELLDTTNYNTLVGSGWVKQCLDRMGILDQEKQLTFQKVLLHKARDIAMHGPGVQDEGPLESQEAQYGSVSPRRSLDDAPVMDSGFLTGPHGEILERIDPHGEPSGTAKELTDFKNAAKKAAEAAATKRPSNQERNLTSRKKKGGMKTKRRKSRSTIKRKSNKNKRKSRRYQRRASSRKARK